MVGEVQTTQPEIDDVGGTKVRSHQAGIGVWQAEEVPNLMGGHGANHVIVAADHGKGRIGAADDIAGGFGDARYRDHCGVPEVMKWSPCS